MLIGVYIISALIYVNCLILLIICFTGAGFEHTIEGVSKSHSGLYSCRAENVVDVTISDLELDVQCKYQ